VVYRINPPIGRAKHSVSFHDGVKTHKDGSPFFDLEICRGQRAKDRFVRQLEKQGYKPS
jgi:hypothetical protein